MAHPLIIIMDYYEVDSSRDIWKHQLTVELENRGYWVDQINLNYGISQCENSFLGDLLIINPWGFTLPTTREIYRSIIRKAKAKGTKIIIRTDPRYIGIIDEIVFMGKTDYDGVINNNGDLEESISKIEELLSVNKKALVVH